MDERAAVRRQGGDDVVVTRIVGRSSLLATQSPSRPGFLAAVAEALGLGEPPGAGRRVLIPGSADYCLGYARHRWFVSVETARAPDLLRRIEALTPVRSGVVYDVSGGLAGVSLVGPFSRRLLNKGCNLNLDELRFPPGAGTRCFFVHGAAFIVRPGAQDAFELFYDRSLDHAAAVWFEQMGAGLAL